MIPDTETGGNEKAPGIVPGAGSLLALLQAATDVTPFVIGKPAPTMLHAAVDMLGADPRRIRYDAVQSEEGGRFHHAVARDWAEVGPALEVPVLVGQHGTGPWQVSVFAPGEDPDPGWR